MREQISDSNLLILEAETVTPASKYPSELYLAGASFAFWTLPVVLEFLQFIFAYLFEVRESDLKFFLAFVPIQWYFWVPVSLIVFWIGHRYPLADKRSIRYLLLFHLPFGLVSALSQILLLTFILLYWFQEKTNFSRVFFDMMNGFNSAFLTYLGILAFCTAFNYSRRYRERELHAANLENELSQAHLRALQMQLQPHFLFNTLNSISALMFKNVKAANTMLARLSDLLRISLSQETVQLVRLEDELDFLRTYLEIEQIRFQDRLSVDFKIARETLDALVPSLILQPLVENSIKHGVAKRRGDSLIEITSRRLNDRLQLKVRDSGNGSANKNTFNFKEGVGLSNTRRRLQKLYESNHSFDISASPDGQFVTTIIIPLRLFEDEQDSHLNS